MASKKQQDNVKSTAEDSGRFRGQRSNENLSDSQNPDDFEILDLDYEPQRRTPSVTDLDRGRSQSGSIGRSLEVVSVSDSSTKTYQETDIDEVVLTERENARPLMEEGNKANETASSHPISTSGMRQEVPATEPDKNTADFSPITDTVQRSRADPPIDLAQEMDYVIIEQEGSNGEEITPPRNVIAESFVDVGNEFLDAPVSQDQNKSKSGSHAGYASKSSGLQSDEVGTINEQGKAEIHSQIEILENESESGDFHISSDESTTSMEDDSDSGDYDTQEAGPDTTGADHTHVQLKSSLSVVPEEDSEEEAEVDIASGHAQTANRFSIDSKFDIKCDDAKPKGELNLDDYGIIVETKLDIGSDSEIYATDSDSSSVTDSNSTAVPRSVVTGTKTEVSQKPEIPHVDTDVSTGNCDVVKININVGGKTSEGATARMLDVKSADRVSREKPKIPDILIEATGKTPDAPKPVAEAAVPPPDIPESWSGPTGPKPDDFDTGIEDSFEKPVMPIVTTEVGGQMFDIAVTANRIEHPPDIPETVTATEGKSPDLTDNVTEDVGLKADIPDTCSKGVPKAADNPETVTEADNQKLDKPVGVFVKPDKPNSGNDDTSLITDNPKTVPEATSDKLDKPKSNTNLRPDKPEQNIDISGPDLDKLETDTDNSGSVLDKPEIDTDTSGSDLDKPETVTYLSGSVLDKPSTDTGPSSSIVDRQPTQPIGEAHHEIESEQQPLSNVLLDGDIFERDRQNKALPMEESMMGRELEDVDRQSELSCSTNEWDALSEKSTEEILSEAVDTLKGGHESRQMSRGRRRKKDKEKRARSGSAKRYYDWNSSHFFPDIHETGEFEALSPLPKTPEKRRSRYNDFIEEEWVRDQIREQLEIELRKQQQELNKQLQEQQQQRLEEINNRQGDTDVSSAFLEHSGKFSKPTEQHDKAHETQEQKAKLTYKWQVKQTYDLPTNPLSNEERVTMATENVNHGRRVQNESISLTRDGSRALEKTQIHGIGSDNKNADKKKNAQDKETRESKSGSQRALSDKTRPFGPDIIHPSVGDNREHPDEDDSLSSDPEDGPKRWTKSPLHVNRRRRKDRPSSQEIRLNITEASREPPSSPTRSGIKMGSPRVQLKPREPAFTRSPHRQSAPQMGTKSVKKLAANPGGSDDMQVKYDKFAELQRRRAALESTSDEHLNSIQKQSVQDSLRRYQKHTRQHGALVQHKTDRSPANRQLFKEKSEEKEIFITGPAMDQSNAGKQNDEYANDFLMQMKKRLKSVNKSQEDIHEEVRNTEDIGHDIIVERSHPGLQTKYPKLTNQNKGRREPQTKPGVIKPIDNLANARVTNISQTRKYIQNSQISKAKPSSSESKQWEEQVEIFPFTETSPSILPKQRNPSSTSEIRSTTDTPTSQISERSSSSRRNLDARSLILEEKKKFEEYKRDYVRRQSSKESSGEELSSSECRSPTQRREIPPDEYEYVLRKIHHTRQTAVVDDKRADQLSPRMEGKDKIPDFMMEPQNRGKYLDKKKYFQGQYEGSYWLDSDHYLQKQQQKLKQRHSSGDFEDTLSPRATSANYSEPVFYDSTSNTKYHFQTTDQEGVAMHLDKQRDTNKSQPYRKNEHSEYVPNQRQYEQFTEPSNQNQYPTRQSDQYPGSQSDRRTQRDNENYGYQQPKHKHKLSRDDSEILPYEQYDYENKRGVNNARVVADFDHTPPAKVDANPEVFPRFQPRYGSLPRDHGSRASAFEQYSKRHDTHHSISPHRIPHQTPHQHPRDPDRSMRNDPTRQKPYQDGGRRKAPPKPLRSALKSRSLPYIGNEDSDVHREQFDYQPERVQETVQGFIPPTPYTRMDYSPQYRVAPETEKVSPRDAHSDNKQSRHIWNTGYQPESPPRSNERGFSHPDIIPYGNTWNERENNFNDRNTWNNRDSNNFDDLPPPPPELLEPQYSTLDPYQDRSGRGVKRDQSANFDPEWAYARRQQPVQSGFRPDPSDFDRYTWSAPPVMHPSQDPYHHLRKPYDVYRVDDHNLHRDSPNQHRPANDYSPSRSRLQQPPDQPLTAYQPLRDRSPYQCEGDVEHGSRPVGYGDFPMSPKERDRYVREYVPTNDHEDAAPRHKPSSLKRRNKGEQHKRYSQPLDGAYDANRFAPLDAVGGAGNRPLDGGYGPAAAVANKPLDETAPGAQSRPLESTYDSVGSAQRPMDASYDSTLTANRTQSRPHDYSTGTWNRPLDASYDSSVAAPRGQGQGSIPIYRTDSREREEQSYADRDPRSASVDSRDTQRGTSKKTYTQIYPPPPDATVFEFTPAEQKVFVKQLETKLIDLKKSDPKRYSSYEEKVSQYVQGHKQSMAAASYEEHIARSRSQYRSQHESDLSSAAEKHQRVTSGTDERHQRDNRQHQRDPVGADQRQQRDDRQRQKDPVGADKRHQRDSGQHKRNQDYVQLDVIRQRKGESRAEQKEKMKRSKSLPREQESKDQSFPQYSQQSSGFARQAKTTQSFRQSPERNLPKTKNDHSEKKATLRPARSAENLVNTKDDIPAGSVSNIKERLFGPTADEQGGIPIQMVQDPGLMSTNSKRIKSEVFNKRDEKPPTFAQPHTRSTSYLSDDKDERIREYVSYKDGKTKKRSQIFDDLTDLEYTYDRLNLDDDNLMSGAANHDFNIPPHAQGDSFEPNVKRLSITNVKKFEDMLQRHIEGSENPSLDYAKKWLSHEGEVEANTEHVKEPKQERFIQSPQVQSVQTVPSYHNRPESSLPRKKTDDMAYRKIHPYPDSTSTRSNQYGGGNQYGGYSPKTTPAPSVDASNKESMQRRALFNQPDPVYDDVVNRAMRRSRSPEKKDPNQVVLPSATTTDYLKSRNTEPDRGRLRMKPQPNYDKYHDDMAYKRLRRDVSPVKIEISSSSSYYDGKIPQLQQQPSLKSRSRSLERTSAMKQQQRQCIPIRRSNSFEREPPRDLPRLPKSMDRGVAKMVQHFSVASKELSRSAPNLNEVFAPQYNSYGDLVSVDPKFKHAQKPKKKETPRIVKQRSEFKSKSKTKSGDSGFYPESGESDSHSSGTDYNPDHPTDGAYESDDIDKKLSKKVQRRDKNSGSNPLNYNNNNKMDTTASSNSSPFPSARSSDESKLESELATELSHFNTQLSKLEFIDSASAPPKHQNDQKGTEASRPSYIDLSTVKLKPVSNVIIRHSPSPQAEIVQERKSPFQLKREMLRHVQTPDGVEEDEKVEVRLTKPKAFAYKSQASTSSHTVAAHTHKETVYSKGIDAPKERVKSMDFESPKETIYSTGFEAPKPKKEMDDFDQKLQEAKLKLTSELSPRLRRNLPISISLAKSDNQDKKAHQSRPLSVDASLTKLRADNEQQEKQLKFTVEINRDASARAFKKQYPKSPWPYDIGSDKQQVGTPSDKSGLVTDPFKQVNVRSDGSYSPGNYKWSESKTSVTKTPTGESETSRLQQQSFEHKQSKNQYGGSVTETREREVHVVRRHHREIVTLPTQRNVATVQPQQIMSQSKAPIQTSRDNTTSQSQPVVSHARQWSRELSDGELTDATDITIDSLVRANQPTRLPTEIESTLDSDDSTISGNSQEASNSKPLSAFPESQSIKEIESTSGEHSTSFRSSQQSKESSTSTESSSYTRSKLESSYKEVDISGVVLRKKEMSEYKREVKKEIKDERRLSLKDRVKLFEDQSSSYLKGPRVNED